MLLVQICFFKVCEILTLPSRIIVNVYEIIGHPYLGSVLVNTVNYYQQFAPSVTSHSSQLTSVIDKEINVRP